MIGHLRGKITHLGDRYAILDVQGVGYKIYTTAPNLLLSNNEEESSFWTHLVVREDVLDLYGFKHKNELDFFELLISVSGVGPKSALGILSIADTETLKKAVAGGNSSYLTSVAGIGKKSAEKIILELRDKIGALAQDGSDLGQEEDVMAALQALGYSLREAREAIKKLPAEITDTNARIKEALKFVSR